MSPHVRVVRGADGALLAAKSAWPPEDESRLVREAALLVAARHPGVVPLVGLAHRDGALELHTRWVGSRSLADVVPLPVDQAAAVVGAVAATVADLHHHGIAHGSIEPTHVLLDDGGRPVLCSFGRAHLTAGRDPGPTRVAAATDVAAIGDLLEAVLGLADDPEIVPDRRLGRRRSNHLHRHLLNIADHARAHEPASRPSAAALAATLAELAPQPMLPRSTGAEIPGPARDVGSARHDDELSSDLERLRASATTVVRSRRRRWPFGLAALGILVSVSGAAALATGTSAVEPFEPVDPTGPRHASVPSVVEPETTTTTATGAMREPAPHSPAPVVELDGAQYTVGQPGDIAVVGPWRCDARPRALLLRPTTGELFLFDEVARPGADARVPAFARRDGATGLVAPVPGDECPQAATVDEAGRITTVVFPASRS